MDALWQLVWSGLVTNDTFAPLRAYLGSTAKGTGGRAGPGTRRSATRAYRTRGVRPSNVIAAGPPSAGGRWSLLPARRGRLRTVRAKAMAELLLERHGVVTRGSVVSEGIRGGFALAYKVLSGFEETGRARRGYFVDGLGAAQFATGATVDRLRGFVIDSEAEAAARGAHARGHRSCERVRRRAAVADDRRSPSRPQGGRARHHGRRQARALHRARRQVGADVHG